MYIQQDDRVHRSDAFPIRIPRDEHHSKDASMDFEWDENKRRKIIAERDVDILHAAGIFEGEYLTSVDDRSDYGEERLISLGMVEDECFVVVHTERKGVSRLITACKGGRDERRDYQAGIARRDQGDETGG